MKRLLLSILTLTGIYPVIYGAYDQQDQLEVYAMQKIKKLLLALLFLSFSGLNVQIAASAEKQQSWFGKSTQVIYDHTSEIADITLALSAVWLAVGAIGTYRLANVPEKSIPVVLHTVLSWFTDIFNIEEKIQLEFTGLGCAGGSLSALSLLLLKKLSWEKKQNNLSPKTIADIEY